MVGFIEDIRWEMARATVYAVPLRMASGARIHTLEGAAVEERARLRVERDYHLGVLRRALGAWLDPMARPRTAAAGGGVSS